MVISARTSLVEIERNSDPNCFQEKDHLFAHIVYKSRIRSGFIDVAGYPAPRMFLPSLLLCLLLSWFWYQVSHDSEMAIASALTVQ